MHLWSKMSKTNSNWIFLIVRNNFDVILDAILPELHRFFDDIDDFVCVFTAYGRLFTSIQPFRTQSSPPSMHIVEHHSCNEHDSTSRLNEQFDWCDVRASIDRCGAFWGWRRTWCRFIVTASLLLVIIGPSSWQRRATLFAPLTTLELARILPVASSNHCRISAFSRTANVRVGVDGPLRW